MTEPEPLSSLPFRFVDFSSDPLEVASQNLVDTLSNDSSDASDITIWCQSITGIYPLQLHLNAAARATGRKSLLLPTISTLQEWLWKHVPPKQPLINETNKQLLLMEAIRKVPSLFNTSNAWPVAKELVTLLNECTLSQIPFDKGPDGIYKLLSKGYESPFSELQNISRESEIIYRIWTAYNEQIQAKNWLDPLQHYCRSLIEFTPQQSNQSYYVVGKHRIAIAEALFFKNVTENNSLTIYYPHLAKEDYGTGNHPHNVYFDHEALKPKTEEQQRSAAIRLVYANSAHIKSRIKQATEQFDANPFKPWLNLFTTTSVENHVHAICLQTKKWMLEQQVPIGIVCNDRLLTRRIRAVLEDDGIQANDSGGWALSTTSAATVIESILDAIENNFSREPLFDLLLNPFLTSHQDAFDNEIEICDIYQRAKNNRGLMHGGISNLITFIKEQKAEQSGDYSATISLLENISIACKSLLADSYEEEIPLQLFAQHLEDTLSVLGIKSHLQNDEAGTQLLSILETSVRTIQSNEIKLGWHECRQWLRDLLEHNFFIPDSQDKRVTLCSFDHLDTNQFTSVIVAGVEEKRLNSHSGSRTFFNEKVRKELHLQTNNEINAVNYVRFRQLLERSRHVLLTAETESNGEIQEISPWVKMIDLFNKEAFNTSLQSNTLKHLLARKKYIDELMREKQTIEKCKLPHPIAPGDLLPARISATQYQSIMNCPYQYFVKYILDIKSDRQTDELDNSEFGNLVHQCLHDYHFNKSGNPRFRNIDFSANTRETLIDKLHELSLQIFMRTAYPDAIKEGWLRRWTSNIPSYIDWCISRSQAWRPSDGERTFEEAFTNTIKLHGQIDRVDTNGSTYSIVDYKTGAAPSKTSVMTGETVQLPFYALLSERINQAEYLELNKQYSAESKTILNEDELDELKSKHQSRLTQLLADLTNNAELPASGEDNVCRYCEYEGFCRKSHWNPTSMESTDDQAKNPA